MIPVTRLMPAWKFTGRLQHASEAERLKVFVIDNIYGALG